MYIRKLILKINKMKNLIMLVCICVLSSCNQPAQNPDFEKNVELAKNYFETFTAENSISDLLSDDVEWRSCFYGAPAMNKEQTIEYAKGWQGAMENITYTAENFLPGVDPETGQLNGSVRTYGTWTGTNTASGKSFEIYMYHYFTFNEEGKIINSGDFVDATGLMMAVAPDAAE